jgi:anthranilate synthase component 1
MTFDEFRKHIERTRSEDAERVVVPVARRLSADLLTPVSAFLHLREAGDFGVLLESVEGGEKLARYSFLATRPYCVVKAHGPDVNVSYRRDSMQRETPSGDIFEVLRELSSRYAPADVPDLPRFTGGGIGYLGYDNVRLVENLPDAPPDDLELPDALWCFYDTVAAFDHVTHQLVLIANAFTGPDANLRAAYDAARSRLDDLAADLRASNPPSPAPVEIGSETLVSNVSREAFEKSVETAREHIYDGDIFQVVLSQRFETPFEGDRFNLYRALRQVNPSPYLFYLDFDDVTLAGSSPEVLVRAEDDTAEVLPIAGTRPRGADDAEDAALEDELLSDAKERAEHLMLVDLGRNDLGRVCDYGSVEVDRYAYVERYSHVMHIVSSVSGRMRADRDAMDALAACFPAGTVSGAPKVRAMEIIDKLETTRRGPYAGAVGYLGFGGALDTCITIRTMVVRGDDSGGTAYVQAGAGIVADSDPAREYEETRDKARALHQAMQMAGDGLL